jgi:hypothetical protein
MVKSDSSQKVLTNMDDNIATARPYHLITKKNSNVWHFYKVDSPRPQGDHESHLIQQSKLNGLLNLNLSQQQAELARSKLM